MTRFKALIISVAGWLTSATTHVLAEEASFRSGPQPVWLLELFTSEGCSSCPPAEKWLGALREDPRLWHEFVPVAWHVDYWDRLGWRDRFSAIVGADTLAVRKPDPAPAREAIARAGGGRAVLIGDSITDAETARAAGLPFVAASFGFSDRPVEALGADAVIGAYAALRETLAAL